jgi:large subunit ribosomal protein L9
MKVLLIKDVYNLGRAGEVKKVADGFARNFLLPQKLAVKATVGSIKQIEKITEAAAKKRELINAEMSELAEAINGLALEFTAKVGETGRLFGSITPQMIVDAINEKVNVNIDRHQLETEPVREIGVHTVKVRLTYDLIPEVQVTVLSEEEETEEPEVEKQETDGGIEIAEAVKEEALGDEEKLEQAEDEAEKAEPTETEAPPEEE